MVNINKEKAFFNINASCLNSPHLPNVRAEIARSFSVIIIFYRGIISNCMSFKLEHILHYLASWASRLGFMTIQEKESLSSENTIQWNELRQIIVQR